MQLIHNPASGSHHELRLDILAQAFAACGASVASSETRLDGATEIHANSDLLCVSGGDGTLGLVISALIEQDMSVPVCVFPAGTVNLIARELGYASDPELFAREVMTGFVAGSRGRLTEPLLAADGSPVIACLSAGPDGVAVSSHSPEWKQRIGKAAYALSFLQLFVRWPRYRFDLQVGGKDNPVTHGCEAFYIAKGRYFAGPWSLSPDASLGQDDFELVLLKRAGRRAFLRFMWAVARGKDPGKLRHVRRLRARSVALETCPDPDALAAFQIDGDPIKAIPTRMEITCHKIVYCLPQAG